jgi:AraC-type DNA-binding domain-containing proteins
MGENQIIGDEMFSDGRPRIFVMDAEHHGKVWKHSHSFIELVFIVNGFALHSCNGHTMVLTAGDLFAIRPGDVHSYISAYHTNLYNCLFYIEDLGSFREELGALTGLDTVMNATVTENSDGEIENLPVLHVDVPERRELELMLEKIKWERENRAIGWEVNIKCQLVSFLVKYSRLLGSQLKIEKDTQDNMYYGHIYRVLQYIEENYAQDISQKSLAEYTDLSPDYMSRRFKAMMNMTPSEYIRKFRIAKSMELLRMTDKSVAEIAGDVGMGDISLYSRVFKQVVGVSPASFRKKDLQ